ncbi:MAG: ABC transporter ATP-binding protein [Eubacteriales bacterium]|nr:ABC transporter ATP-binding protein [Eubacteriales bacterium]
MSLKKLKNFGVKQADVVSKQALQEQKDREIREEVSKQLESLEARDRRQVEGSLLSGRKGVWKSFGGLIVRSHLPIIWIIATVVMSLIATRISAIFPRYQQVFFGENPDFSARSLGIGILILFAGLVTSLLDRFISGRTGVLISKQVRDTLWSHTVGLPIRVFRHIPPRDFISRVTSDADTLSESLTLVITILISSTYAVFLYLAEMYQMHRGLALAQFALLPLFLIVKFITGRIKYTLSYRYRFRFASLTRYMAALLVNIPLIKSFHREKFEAARGRQIIDAYCKVGFASEAASISFDLVDQCFQIINDAICILYGAYLIAKGELDIGAWIGIYIYASGAYSMIQIITNLWPTVKGAQGSMQRIQDILELEQESYANSETPRNFNLDDDNVQDLRIKDLSYSYDETEVLHQLNYSFTAGKKTAIVGPSGSGKSTLLRILLRLDAPSSGEIHYGKHAAEDYGLAAWRKLFSYLPQDIQLYHGNVRDNLVYGLETKVTDEELWQVLSAVDLDSKIQSLPNGLDSEISEGAQSLSGGERQRLAIARLLLVNPAIVLLDEATSNLDAISEHQVQIALDRLALGRSMIIVAHRLSTILNADEIVLLKDGRIEAAGQHGELLKNSADYRELYEGETDREEEEILRAAKIAAQTE